MGREEGRVMGSRNVRYLHCSVLGTLVTGYVRHLARQAMMTSGSPALGDVGNWRSQPLVTAIGHRQPLVSSGIGGSQFNSDDVRYLCCSVLKTSVTGDFRQCTRQALMTSGSQALG